MERGDRRLRLPEHPVFGFAHRAWISVTCSTTSSFAPWPRAEGSQRLARGVGINHLGRDTLAACEIPLLPIEEQRRLAAILDRADELRAKRRAVTRPPLLPHRVDLLRDVRRPRHQSEGLACCLAGGCRGSDSNRALRFAATPAEYVEDGVPLVNPTHIVQGRIVADRQHTVTAEKAAGSTGTCSGWVTS